MEPRTAGYPLHEEEIAVQKRIGVLEEVRALAAKHSDSVHLSTLYSHPHPEDKEGMDYDQSGRIDAKALKQLVPTTNAEFYVCGPKSFLGDIVSFLTARGVADNCIHFESFT